MKPPDEVTGGGGIGWSNGASGFHAPLFLAHFTDVLSALWVVVAATLAHIVGAVRTEKLVVEEEEETAEATDAAVLVETLLFTEQRGPRVGGQYVLLKFTATHTTVLIGTLPFTEQRGPRVGGQYVLLKFTATHTTVLVEALLFTEQRGPRVGGQYVLLKFTATHTTVLIGTLPFRERERVRESLCSRCHQVYCNSQQLS